jgi:hypothetical protein
MDNAKSLGWVVGIDLNLTECSRIYTKGSGAMQDTGGYGDGANGGGNGGSLDSEVHSKVAKYMLDGVNSGVLTNQERTVVNDWDAFVRGTVLFKALQTGVARDNTLSYMGKFKTLKNGNVIPAMDEYDSDVEDCMNVGELTRWETLVISRYWKFFSQVAPREREDGSIESMAVVYKKGVVRESARKYVRCEFRTVKIHVLMRDNVNDEARDKIEHMYTLALVCVDA